MFFVPQTVSIVNSRAMRKLLPTSSSRRVQSQPVTRSTRAFSLRPTAVQKQINSLVRTTKRFQSATAFGDQTAKPKKAKDFDTFNVNFDWSTMEGELPDLPPEDEPLTKKDRWWEDIVKDKSRYVIWF